MATILGTDIPPQAAPMDSDGSQTVADALGQLRHTVRYLQQVTAADAAVLYNHSSDHGWRALFKRGLGQAPTLPGSWVATLGNEVRHLTAADLAHVGNGWMAGLLVPLDVAGSGLQGAVLLTGKNPLADHHENIALLSHMAPMLALTLQSVRRTESNRIHAERAQRARQAELGATLDSIGDGLIATDLQGRVVRMNPIAQSLTGVRLEDAIGHNVRDVFAIVGHHTRGATPTQDDDPIAEALVNDTIVHRRQINLVRDDAPPTPITASFSALHNAQGEVCGSVIVFRDRTEEQRSEDALRRSKEQFQQLIERNPDCVAIVRDGRWAYANPALCHALGYSDGYAMRDRDVVDAAEPVDRAALRALLASENTTNEFQKIRFARTDGEVVILELGTPQTIDDGPARLLVARDVTKQVRMEAQLVLADKLASVGSLASGVAHEINNPLAYMLANMEYAQDTLASLDGHLPAKERQLLNELVGETHAGAEKVRRIVHNLQAMTRSSAPSMIDVRSVMDATLAIARSQIRSKAKVTTSYAEVPAVFADESRLGQLFLHLIKNATSAVQDKGPDGRNVHIKIAPAERSVSVEVADTGAGIRPEHLDRIFDPFFTTQSTGGAGLGLSICHSIVSSLAGQISVSSVEGEGAIFKVELPTDYRQQA